MQAVAIGAIVTDVTGSASWGAIIAAVTFLAAGIVTPFGGVLADRYDRRGLVLFTSVAMAIAAVALAGLYVAGRASPLLLTVVVAIEGCLVAVALPARTAMIPDLVEKDEHADAYALFAMSWNMGRIIGSGLAGAVIAFGSYSWVFMINAVSFLGMAVAMAFIRAQPSVPTEDESVMHRLRAGFAGVRADPGCWSVIRMLALMAILIAPFIALVPAMAQLVFHGDAVDTARFVTAQGVGAVLGAVAVGALHRRIGRNQTIVASLFTLPLVMIGYSIAPSEAVALVPLAMLGGNYVITMVSMGNVMQLRAPVAMRGRYASTFVTTLGFAYPVGAVLQGLLADIFGVRQVQAVAASLFLVVVLVCALWRPQVLAVMRVDGDSAKASPETELPVGEPTP